MAKFIQGVFRLGNPGKYKGDPTNIIYRSRWELLLMNRLDTDPNILAWSSEEVIIPYYNPLTGRKHRYFPDFKVWTKGPDGFEKVTIIEIKPYKETVKPDPSTGLTKKGSPTKRFLTEATTYVKNEAKWEAAKAYCASRNWNFVIFTEYELGIAKRK